MSTKYSSFIKIWISFYNSFFLLFFIILKLVSKLSYFSSGNFGVSSFRRIGQVLTSNQSVATLGFSPEFWVTVYIRIWCGIFFTFSIWKMLQNFGYIFPKNWKFSEPCLRIPVLSVMFLWIFSDCRSGILFRKVLK